MIRKLAVLAGLLAAISPALAQKDTRSVGSFSGAGGQFRGTLGTSGLSGFRGFSSGVPQANVDISHSLLSPSGYRPATAGPIGGLVGDYRLSPQGLSSPLGSAGSRVLVSPALPRLAPTFSGPVISGGAGPDLDSLPYFSSSSALVGPQADGELSPPPSAAVFGRLDQPIALPAAPPSVAFDLAGQSKANPRWQQAAELVREGKLADAGEPARAGLALSPGRPEGEWLLAILAVDRGDYADAVFRLRNGLTVCPKMLGGTAGEVVRLAGRENVQRWLSRAAGSRGDAKSAERRLSAAWLAIDLGDVEKAQALLAETTVLTGASRAVAARLRMAVSLPPLPGEPAPGATARESMPEAPAAAAPLPASTQLPTQPSAPSPTPMVMPPAAAISLDQWLLTPAGRTFGVTPAGQGSHFGQLNHSLASPESGGGSQ